MWALFFIACLAHRAFGYVIVVNTIFDTALYNANQNIQDGSGRVFQIGDLHLDGNFMKLSALHVECWNGTVKWLGQLRRSGNVTASVDGKRTVLEGAVGVEQLEAGYPSCRVRAARYLKLNPALTAVASGSSVRFRVTLMKGDGMCASRLDEVRLATLGVVRLRKEAGIGSRVARALIKPFIKNLSDHLQGNVEGLLRKNIPLIDFCY